MDTKDSAHALNGICLPEKSQATPLTPRLDRLLRALLASINGLSREQCDRATPCSNSPQYISCLRYRYGLDIPCHLRPFVTIDGTKGTYGVYCLTSADREKLSQAGLVVEA